MSDMIVGLDIGTSMIRAVIGEFTENEKLQITGVGKALSTGLRNGTIVNIDSTLHSVVEAIEAAEMMSGREVESCITAIGGSQIESFNSRGVVSVAGRSRGIREITSDDVERVIETAKAVPVPPDREILHVVPQSYTIDGQGKIRIPLNMIGVRLESEVHIVTAAKTSVQNILRCMQRGNYSIDSVMLKTLAAANAVTNEEERELGSVIIDLGGGSTDALVLADGAPVCTASVPVGGSIVTNDVSIVCGISYDSAERIKKSSGCCWEPLLDTYEEVIIPGLGGRPPEVISRTEICRIIQPRVEEMLTMVRDKIITAVKNRQLAGNVVLIGGGALLPGIVDVACQVFDTRAVRIGIPGNFGGLQDEYRVPEYATAVGLVVSNMNRFQTIEDKRSDVDRKKHKTKGSGFFTGWLKEFF